MRYGVMLKNTVVFGAFSFPVGSIVQILGETKDEFDIKNIDNLGRLLISKSCVGELKEKEYERFSKKKDRISQLKDVCLAREHLHHSTLDEDGVIAVEKTLDLIEKLFERISELRWEK